jgi:hypothetical protein
MFRNVNSRKADLVHFGTIPKPDPSGRCFLAAFQGLTITQELQPNGLHPVV